jgi:DNA-binding MarR family transcriptional regulator
MNSDNYIELMEKLYKTMNVLNQEMKTARDYGIGFDLYHSEVGLLEIIKTHKNATASDLSRTLGVTTGAVWQVSRKLQKKGLIESYQAENNKKDVYFRLTALGEKVSRGHQKHHETINAGIFDYLSRLEKRDTKKIGEFLDTIAKEMANVLWP